MITISLLPHRPNGHDAVEVVDVHVDKHPEESSQDLLAQWDERLGEGNI